MIRIELKDISLLPICNFEQRESDLFLQIMPNAEFGLTCKDYSCNEGPTYLKSYLNTLLIVPEITRRHPEFFGK